MGISEGDKKEESGLKVQSWLNSGLHESRVESGVASRINKRTVK